MSKPTSPAPASDAAATDGLWIGPATDRVFATFPHENIYTCAAGMSPSGIVHFGNFRDVITSFAVASEIKARGKNVRMILSWDDYDRFRKVPAGVDPSFSKYIGYPLTSVPDPEGKYPSYARRYEEEFEKSMAELGIPLDYISQTKEYTSGRYAERIAFALSRRKDIADIQLRFKTDKGNKDKGIDPAEFRETYFPVTVYSRFSGADKAEILSYDGGTKLTYRCVVTGKTETIDFKETPVVKLQWKVDWAMRWGEERVNFEPFGKDHATPGGSYDVSGVIAREIFGREPPVPQPYEFVGIHNVSSKMSGSSGLAVSPGMLLQIYEPALLKWLYLRRLPTQSFNLAFDSEVYRQYDEFDREVAACRQDGADAVRKKIVAFSGMKIDANDGMAPIPFKQAVALGQITQWQSEKLRTLAEKSGFSYDTASIERRLPKARAWLVTYNPSEIIELRSDRNLDYFSSLDGEAKGRIEKLHAFLAGTVESVAELEEQVYAIPKQPSMSPQDMKVAQRQFFKDAYTLLIGKDTGPRLSTFLWAVDRKRVLNLLNFGAS
jgi:lysyl-tRNA synthetase class 1